MRITIPIEEDLARAVEMQAAREKTNRVAWITEAIKDKLESIGKLP